jgi:uncharacterized Fe-S cluster protein YjdI
MASLDVRYDPKVCQHAALCVKGLPKVFRVENKKFVIDPSAASEAEVRAQVAKCPSGALTLVER